MFNVKLLQNYHKSSLPTVRKETTNFGMPFKNNALREIYYTALQILSPQILFSLLLPSPGSLSKQLQVFFKAIYFFCFLKPLQFENAYRKVLGVQSTIYQLLLLLVYITSTYPVIDLHVLKFLLKSMETSRVAGGGGNQRQETVF